MDSFFYLLTFLGYFVLVLGVASACGMAGYFIGAFLGWGIGFLLRPIIGEDAVYFLAVLFGITGYCLGCVFGAVLTLSQVSRRRAALGSSGDLETVEAPSASAPVPTPPGDES